MSQGKIANEHIVQAVLNFLASPKPSNLDNYGNSRGIYGDPSGLVPMAGVAASLKPVEDIYEVLNSTKPLTEFGIKAKNFLIHLAGSQEDPTHVIKPNDLDEIARHFAGIEEPFNSTYGTKMINAAKAYIQHKDSGKSLKLFHEGTSYLGGIIGKILNQ